MFTDKTTQYVEIQIDVTVLCCNIDYDELHKQALLERHSRWGKGTDQKWDCSSNDNDNGML